MKQEKKKQNKTCFNGKQSNSSEYVLGWTNVFILLDRFHEQHDAHIICMTNLCLSFLWCLCVCVCFFRCCYAVTGISSLSVFIQKAKGMKAESEHKKTPSHFLSSYPSRELASAAIDVTTKARCNSGWHSRHCIDIGAISK